MRHATFEKDGELYTVTKRGLFYTEGYRLVERENGTAREYDMVPRNFIGRFYDWLEDVELDHTGPFWGTATILFLAFLAYFGSLIFIIEPWIYGINVDAAIVIAFGALCAVAALGSVWEWFTEAIIPWVRWRKMMKVK